MDEAQLSAQEKAFVEQYKLLSEPIVQESDEEKQVEREKRSSRLFNAWIGLLVITPIFVSVIFSVIAERVLAISENESYKQLLDNYDDKELKELTGLDSEKMGLMALLGDNLALVILGIFASFGLLIALSYLIRYALHNHRSRNVEKARKSNSK